MQKNIFILLISIVLLFADSTEPLIDSVDGDTIDRGTAVNDSVTLPSESAIRTVTPLDSELVLDSSEKKLLAIDTLTPVTRTTSQKSDTTVSVESRKAIKRSKSTPSLPKILPKNDVKKGVGLMILVTLILILLIVIFVRFLKGSRDQGNFLTQTRISIMDREVQIVCQYIEEHYAESSLTPERVCEELSTGYSFVETLFKKELDMTLAGFIMHVRVHHAVNLINEGFTGDDTELMDFCGYSDLTLFKSDFKVISGVTLDSILNSL